ncbi:MAG: hypothetical protein R2733_24940 [Acidimicrobiales bacterium]
MFDQQRGRVVAFESPRGVGTVAVADPDGASYPFHCTNIADGTREIADGAAVTFRVVAVGPGVWEAVDVQAIGPT